MVAHEKRNSAQLFCAVPTRNDFALSSLLFPAQPTQKLGYPHLHLICFVWRVRPVRGGVRRDGAGRCLHHGRLAYPADDVSPSTDRSPFFPEINVGLLAGPWFEGRMAQCLTDILGGRATAAAMVTLAAAYLAVTLLVQGARFVKRFYVRRLTNNGAINFNGYTITLADGTVLR